MIANDQLDELLERAAKSETVALRIDQFRDLIAQAKAALAKPEELSAARGCPCLYTTPCKDNCTCVSWTSSAGCARCCTYGSLEQRTKNAERLASLTPSPHSGKGA